MTSLTKGNEQSGRKTNGLPVPLPTLNVIRGGEVQVCVAGSLDTLSLNHLIALVKSKEFSAAMIY